MLVATGVDGVTGLDDAVGVCGDHAALPLLRFAAANNGLKLGRAGGVGLTGAAATGGGDASVAPLGGLPVTPDVGLAGVVDTAADIANGDDGEGTGEIAPVNVMGRLGGGGPLLFAAADDGVGGADADDGEVADVGVAACVEVFGNGGGPLVVNRGGGGGGRRAILPLTDRIASISTSPCSTIGESPVVVPLLLPWLPFMLLL